MTRTALSTLVLSVCTWSWLYGCGGSGSGAEKNDPFHIPDPHHAAGTASGATGSGASGGDDPTTFGGGGGGPNVVSGCDPTMELCVDAGGPGICSDGQLDPGTETCDDGNINSGDGCTATCAVEANFVCPTPGSDCVSTVRCGDDKITGAETCDDSNDEAGDGCDATCTTEPGWSCPIQGAACVAAACGDGIIAGLEECEDGAAVPVAGDGCDATCLLEAGAAGAGGAWEGWVCDTPGMPCLATVCNDGLKEGDEPCDDGNDGVGDGCNPLCEVEPDCPASGGACSSLCGDGLILTTDNEDCDDGNTTDGDGCSSTCTVEGGYMCTVVQQALPASIVIPFVFRDFVAFPSATTTMKRHPDFQNGCLGNPIEDMTTNALDVDGKPVNSGLNVVPAACVLNVGYLGANPGQCDNLDGSNGGTCQPTNAQRSTHPNHPLVGHPGVDPFYFWYRDTPDVNKTLVIPETLTGNAGVYSFNPGGGFFPLNGGGWVASGDEDPWAGVNGNNYGFTSEVRYWFQFQGGETLSFTGDDDLFVYANGELILPIGSKHGATTREVVINANGTATCAACATMSRPHTMTVGNVYEMAIFHAERQASASNFNLSITGFVKAKSECVSVCGDGVVTPDEECDDGAANADDAYNGCTTTCQRSAFCGDGTVNGPEACDDGVNLSQYQGCAPGCVDGPSCGDGIVQSMFEDCDDVTLAGLYGGCAQGCILGPRCGDNIVQTSATNPAENEECDDGNRQRGDGCDPNCKEEVLQ